MWYDADIDALMGPHERAVHSTWPHSTGQSIRFWFDACRRLGPLFALGYSVNMAAASLLAFTIFFYVVVYTMWLKRRTPQNIVIGGASGAFPPVIGWLAAAGGISVEPVLLFLVVFLWTPPHFWALSLYRTGEYARAGIPMLPVVAGKAETQRQILIYTLLLVPIAVSLWPLGFAGRIYGAVSVATGAIMIILALRLRAAGAAACEPARQTTCLPSPSCTCFCCLQCCSRRRGWWSHPPMASVGLDDEHEQRRAHGRRSVDRAGTAPAACALDCDRSCTRDAGARVLGRHHREACNAQSSAVTTDQPMTRGLVSRSRFGNAAQLSSLAR